ncbi:MAG: glycoside hydrolase family 43 protein [Acidimicrobiales bacterium]
MSKDPGSVFQPTPRSRALARCALTVLGCVIVLGARQVIGVPAATATVAPVSLGYPAVIVTPGLNIPDPMVVEVDQVYFMFSSQTDPWAPNVPLMVSGSLTAWPPETLDAMPVLPGWAGGGSTWSPDVRKVGHQWVMWFNAILANGPGTTKCIGVATSPDVWGPYSSTRSLPLVCQLDHLGSIDPRSFVDPVGRLWLLWKSDDNADVNGTTHTTIYVQQLSSSGTSLVGAPVALVTADQPWEGRIVEAPDMVFAGGSYWLFFSGNWYNQGAYAIGVEQCAGPTGPCAPVEPGSWLSSDAQGSGPGEQSLFFDGSRWWMLYSPYAVKYQTPTTRPVALARLTFGPQGPSIVAPGAATWDAPGPTDPLPAAQRVEHRASRHTKRR